MLKVNILERLLLINSVLTNGTPLFLMYMQDKLKFSADEIEKYGLSEKDGVTSWNDEGGKSIVELNLNEAHAIELKNKLDAMGDKFPIGLLEIYKNLK
jgi:hypothetical protein